MSVQIVPTLAPMTIPIITSFNYSVIDFVFNSSISFNVVLLDGNNLPVLVKTVTMAGSDYTNWGQSDQYVINFICNALGLSQLNLPPSSIGNLQQPTQTTE